MDVEHPVEWNNRHTLAIVSSEDGIKINPLVRAALVTGIALSILAIIKGAYPGGFRGMGQDVWGEFPDFIKDFTTLSGGIWKTLTPTLKGLAIGMFWTGTGGILLHALYAPKVIAIKEGNHRTIKAGSFRGEGHFIPAVWRRVDYNNMKAPTEWERNSAKIDLSAKNEEGWAPIYEYQTEAQNYSVSIRVAIAAIPYALFRVVYEVFLLISKLCIFAYDHLTGQERKRWTVGQMIMEIPQTIVKIIMHPCYGTALLIGSIYSFFAPEGGQKLTATIESQWNYSFKEGASIPTNRSFSMCFPLGYAIWGNYLQPCRQILGWVQFDKNNEILNVTDSSGTRPLALALREKNRDANLPNTICDKAMRTYKVFENRENRAKYAKKKMDARNAEIDRLNARTGTVFDLLDVIYVVTATIFAFFAFYSFYKALTGGDTSYVIEGSISSLIALLVVRLLYNDWKAQERALRERVPLERLSQPPCVVWDGKSFAPDAPLFSDPFTA